MGEIVTVLKSVYVDLTEPIRLKQCRYGPMLYLTTDQYIGGALDKYGEFSEGEAWLFQKIVKPGWIVLDVGANHGTHTVCLAKLVGLSGRVHSFEPQRILHQLLCANVALSSLDNVYTYQKALGRKPGQINVPRMDYTRPNNFGALALGGVGGETVDEITVDSLMLPACQFAKIDAEGMEGEIIAGAGETIERYRPYLYVENDKEEKSAALIQQLWDLDYVPYFHLPYYFNRFNYLGCAENIYGGTISVNMLCVHKSRNLDIPTDCHLITSPQDTWKTTLKL